MTLFNLVQLALAVGALAILGQRLRMLLFVAPVSREILMEVIEPALAGGHLTLVRRLGEACRPAWAAQLIETFVAERERGLDPRNALRECTYVLANDGARGIYAVRGCGRIAAPLAFIGVVIEIGRVMSGEQGLVALQRGLAESQGLERALFTFAIGFATALVCFAGAAILQAQSRALRDDLARVERALVERSEPGAER